MTYEAGTIYYHTHNEVHNGMAWHCTKSLSAYVFMPIHVVSPEDVSKTWPHCFLKLLVQYGCWWLKYGRCLWGERQRYSRRHATFLQLTMVGQYQFLGSLEGFHLDAQLNYEVNVCHVTISCVYFVLLFCWAGHDVDTIILVETYTLPQATVDLHSMG